MHEDARGEFFRAFCADELGHVLAGKTIKQINVSLTRNRGTVRGLHYQRPPFTETKIIRCLKGSVFDVAVDLRAGSPTLLQYHAEILSAEKHNMLVIPDGFAHGFQALTDHCEMLYLHTTAYHPEAEGGLHPLDPRLAIPWPLPVQGLSARDANHPLLAPDFAGIAL
jgi:dTDP-4-dehydrorhamnose 3,5-epimerase